MLDRVRQRQMLEALAATYPHHSTSFIDENNPADLANLYYLQEHELVAASLTRTITGDFIFSGACITAKGMDFLADDGGLSAILGTVTVKLHADTIKELLLAKVEASELPSEKKSWLKSQVASLSGEALKTITKSLVEKGLANISDLTAWVQSMLPPGP